LQDERWEQAFLSGIFAVLAATLSGFLMAMWSTPFSNLASTSFGSASKGKVMLRVKLPQRRSDR
jgi:hypothetical protein